MQKRFRLNGGAWGGLRHEKGIYSAVDQYSSILSLAYGLTLIQKFAKEKKMTIEVHKGELWNGDQSHSWLYQRAVNLLKV